MKNWAASCVDISLFQPNLFHVIRSRDSAVHIASRLLAERSGDRVRVGVRDVSLLQNAQAVCEAHPASYSIDSGFSPGLKRPRHDAKHSSPATAEIKKEWSYTSTPPTWFHGVDRDNFTLYSSCYLASICHSEDLYPWILALWGFTVNLKYDNKPCKLFGTTGFMTVRGYRTRIPYDIAVSLWKERFKYVGNDYKFFELISSTKNMKKKIALLTYFELRKYETWGT